MRITAFFVCSAYSNLETIIVESFITPPLAMPLTVTVNGPFLIEPAKEQFSIEPLFVPAIPPTSVALSVAVNKLGTYIFSLI